MCILFAFWQYLACAQSSIKHFSMVAQINCSREISMITKFSAISFYRSPGMNWWLFPQLGGSVSHPFVMPAIYLCAEIKPVQINLDFRQLMQFITCNLVDTEEGHELKDLVQSALIIFQNIMGVIFSHQVSKDFSGLTQHRWMNELFVMGEYNVYSPAELSCSQNFESGCPKWVSLNLWRSNILWSRPRFY